MNQIDIDKAYVSPYDKLLYTFDTMHPLTASQKKEIKKNKRIATLRDNATPPTKDNTLWDKF